MINLYYLPASKMLFRCKCSCVRTKKITASTTAIGTSDKNRIKSSPKQTVQWSSSRKISGFRNDGNEGYRLALTSHFRRLYAEMRWVCFTLRSGLSHILSHKSASIQSLCRKTAIATTCCIFRLWSCQWVGCKATFPKTRPVQPAPFSHATASKRNMPLSDYPFMESNVAAQL